MAYRISSAAHQAIYAGIRMLEAGSCLKFVPRTNQRDYLYFYQGDGCHSGVGRKGGAQENIQKFSLLFILNPQAPVARKIADEVVFRCFQGEGVEFFF